VVLHLIFPQTSGYCLMILGCEGVKSGVFGGDYDRLLILNILQVYRGENGMIQQQSVSQLLKQVAWGVVVIFFRRQKVLVYIPKLVGSFGPQPNSNKNVTPQN